MFGLLRLRFVTEVAGVIGFKGDGKQQIAIIIFVVEGERERVFSPLFRE